MPNVCLLCFSAIIVLHTASIAAAGTITRPSFTDADTVEHQPTPFPSGDSLKVRMEQAAAAVARRDSVAIDTTAVDTLGRMSTPSLVGTYDRTLDSSHVLTKDDLHWLDYRYLGGILESFPGMYVRDQNSAGQYNQLNIRGVDWRGIAITMDGRLLNDPASGIFNLFNFTTEYADRVEVITGPRAFLYGLNSTGGAINLLTRNYNSNRPFTKINYSETGYNYQYSDGTFSQNISHRINITFGFQHQGTDGKFPNSAHEEWNGRVKIRYNFSRDFNAILSEYHTSTQTQLNGGVDYALSGPAAGLSPFQAIMKNRDSYEKITRNDIDLMLVGTFLGDTTDVSTLSFYYSHSLREYRDEENALRTNGVYVFSDHTTSWMGTRFAQNLDTRFQRLALGANVELRQIEGSPNLSHHRNTIGSAWVKEELLPVGGVTVAGFGRYDRYLSHDYAGIGADANLDVTGGLSLFGGLSMSRRLPAYEELFWVDSAVSRADPIVAEKHLQLEIGAMLTLPGRSFVRASYFHRTVKDAIQILPYDPGLSTPFPGLEFTNVPQVVTNGLEVRLGVRLWVLYLEGAGTYMVQTSDGTGTGLYPKVWGNGGIYYWNTVLNDKLEIKAGFKGRYQSSFAGALFNPEVLAYVPNEGTPLGQAASGDMFVAVHIGDAYVHLIWENLTSVEYFSTPYYPVLEREIRLGVSWEFLN